MNDIFICNNPRLLRFTKRQNAAEQGATTYLKRIVEKQRTRAKHRTNRSRNPYTKPRQRKILKSPKPYLP